MIHVSEKVGQMVNKYKITDESIQMDGHTLYRIKALKSFGDVNRGDLGGYIERESNLSQKDNCWIYRMAKVFGSARVYGNARVDVDALVYGNARVFDNAQVADFAKVFGEAWIYGSAWIYGTARVYDNAHVFGGSKVSGNTRIYGYAQVFGDARVFGDAHVLEHASLTTNSWNHGHITLHLEKIIQTLINNPKALTLLIDIEGMGPLIEYALKWGNSDGT